jgi:hypothetical protein
MSYNKDSVLAEARATIRRIDEKKLSEPTYSQLEDPVQKWKREADASDAARAAEQERLGLVARTADEVKQLQADVTKLQRALHQSLQGINSFAEAVMDRIDQLYADVDGLKAAIESKSKSTAVVEQLPNKRREA